MYFKILGCILLGKTISTSSPYILKYGIDESKKTEYNKSDIILLSLTAFFTSRFCNTYLNELRSILVAKEVLQKSNKFCLSLFPTNPYHIRDKVQSIPIFCKQIERSRKAYKSLFSIKYNHVIPTSIEFTCASFLVIHNLGYGFCGLLLSTTALYIYRSIQLTNNRIKEQQMLFNSENNLIQSIDNYIVELTISKEKNKKGLEQINTSLVDISNKEQLNINSLKQLNIEQQAILTTGSIIMSYFWFIDPLLSISDFIMIHMLSIQLFQPLNQIGMIYREWTQSKIILKI
jgi:hypothetical protein